MSLKDNITECINDFCINNEKNKIISSPKLFNGFCCLGIDEAGRGPVLGPMVFGGAYFQIKHLDRYKDIGLDDSKNLKEEQRDELLDKLTKDDETRCGFEIEIISPNSISNQMLDTEKTSLNTMSHNATLGIINRVLEKGVKLRQVYVDTVGRDCEKYQEFINSHFPDLKVVVEKQADSKFKVVSAASIFAKVIRDSCLRNWKHKEMNVKLLSLECGSGYPGDPKTKAYIQEIIDPVFGYPLIVRSSWKTASDIIQSKCIPVEWEDDIEQSANKAGSKRKSVANESDLLNTSNIMNFYKNETQKNLFFKSRKMEKVRSLCGQV